MKQKLPSLPPDKPIMITDSSEARYYAVCFKMLNQALLESTLPATFIINQNHDTHWLVVGLYKGFTKPEDNGMNFFGFPKNQTSLDKVKHLIRSYTGDTYVELENSGKPED